MTENATGLNAPEVAQTDGNLKLASQFIKEYLDDPDRFGPIPDGAAVILLPPEDQADLGLRQANLRMAQRLAAEGRDIVLWTVRTQKTGESQVLSGQYAAGQDT